MILFAFLRKFLMHSQNNIEICSSPKSCLRLKTKGSFSNPPNDADAWASSSRRTLITVISATIFSRPIDIILGWQLPIRVRDLRLLREDPDLHLRPLDDPTRNQPLRLLLLVTPALECRQNENLQRREPVWQRPVP